MRFYLDEHMPLLEVPKRLRRKGHSSQHAVKLGYTHRDDIFHYQYARAQKCILITQDSDFTDARMFPIRKHPGVIILDIPRDADPLTLFEVLEQVLRLFRTAASLYEKKVIAHATHCTVLTESGSQDLAYPS